MPQTLLAQDQFDPSRTGLRLGYRDPVREVQDRPAESLEVGAASRCLVELGRCLPMARSSLVVAVELDRNLDSVANNGEVDSPSPATRVHYWVLDADVARDQAVDLSENVRG